MSSRYAAARPKRAGESFARQHHGGGGGGGDGNGSDDEGASGHDPGKKVTFDMRNPSALAPEAREDDEVLEADVIGVNAGATKRGAVNIDGYDSDSDNETFNARAAQRKRPAKASDAGVGFSVSGNPDVEVNLFDELDNYDKRLKGEPVGDEKNGGKGGGDNADDDDDDMFGGGDDDEDEKTRTKKASKNGDGDTDETGKKKWKEVRFLRNIEGQEEDSKSGGHVRLDEESSSDEEDAELAIQEEGVDEEVGPGGLKKHAPRIDAFNMRQEQEEGAFDESGNYIRKAADADDLHDRWLEGVSKKEMKRAAAAHEKREAELRQVRREEDDIITADVFGALITRLEPGETPLAALARLGKNANQSKKPKNKRIPAWRLKQMEKKKQAQSGDDGDDADQMDVDKTNASGEPKAADDPKQARLKKEIDVITEAADRLLNRDYAEIYDMVREKLIKEYRVETGETWVDPEKPVDNGVPKDVNAAKLWEYRWIDGRDGGVKQGPYDAPTMKAWQDAGYFEGVEFRPAGSGGAWRKDVSFA
ncbi:CD2 antigen cytoplasmic tail-binding protein 2 [Sporothrix schenckii 1099-18]|uniref:GYF domain-containing protein n=2 Tax=Sporothrix schenckii TaxID=29908 RepID=U7PHI0_SPOS1|nr:CD2 antigen cytoplasmic tail-binding protein 2 [Sporothrix schenckii 1099-18]ERS95038.1 hypothetical protein HMPREF1624_08527 [Sporothrix schenckii ATCC 58251]KJR87356.1 CD2 antigen cytoplasmic tail-binding protein 2 [Sporothrix schenckii 1099-18]